MVERRREGRPSTATPGRDKNAKCKARYKAARDLGCGSRQAKAVSDSHAAWIAFLASRGINPAVYGELSEKRAGGKTRTDPARAARYHELRRRGLRAADASRLSKYQGIFVYTVRRLDKGIPVSG